MNKFSFSIKFILEKRRPKHDGRCSIYVRVIQNGIKAEMHLREHIDPNLWDDAKGRVASKSEEAVQINHKISYIEKSVNDIRYELDRLERSYTPKSIVMALKGGSKKLQPLLFEFFDLHINEIIEKKQHSRSVINHYRQARRKLFDYLKTVGMQHVFLRNLSRAHIAGFEHYLLTTIVPVVNKSLCQNTANRYLVKVRAVMNAAILKELITKSPFKGFPIHEVQSTSRVFLTEVELKRIVDQPLHGNPSLDRVRDIFCFSVYTALRWTDATKLKEKDIEKDAEGTLWISIGQDKTGNPLQIPMLRPAEEIYLKYSEERGRTGYVLPRLSNQKFNTFLKEIGRLAGITKTLTHHVARHTCATTILLDNGVDIKAVSEFLGHVELKSTMIYAKVSKRNLAAVAKKINLSIESSKQEIKKDFERISERLAKGTPINYN